MNERQLRRHLTDQGYNPEEVEDRICDWADHLNDEARDRALEEEHEAPTR